MEAVSDAVGSHVVTFKPAEEVTYYFMGVWEKDNNGVTSMESFEVLLDQEVEKLNNPLQFSR